MTSGAWCGIVVLYVSGMFGTWTLLQANDAPRPLEWICLVIWPIGIPMLGMAGFPFWLESKVDTS